ncbi:MAG: TIGR02757 family protein [Cyclobacteriaceae bacterium]
MNFQELKSFLDDRVAVYNQPGFIENDPIAIPHSYSLKQDVEITGFFVAMLAWGQRKTIINKSKELFSLMGNAPYDFMVNHTLSDLKALAKFKHRTFNNTDCLYFIRFLGEHYKKHNSLESAFPIDKGDEHVGNALVKFHNTFFSLEDYPPRTRKHVATPDRKSACKRVNMFLRWMVRKDNKGVDFGIWNTISPTQLICPCDLHVERVARKLNLIKRKPMDWLTAVELTKALKEFDPADPVKYDFALFGLGIEEKF